MTITVASHLNETTRKSVNATLTKFDVSLAKMIREIERTIVSDRELIRIGAAWYREANAFAAHLSNTYGTPIDRASAVISALSPRMGWVRNKTIAESVIAGWFAGKSADEIRGALGANIRMAVAILNGADIDATLTGVKRRSFYNNILTAGQSDDVTVDTWMQRVAMNASTDKGMDLDESLRFLNARKGAGYIAIAEAVRRVAYRHNVPPATVQAAYWIAASGSVHGWHWKGHNKTERDY